MAATTARRLATPSSVNAAIKQIADVMRVGRNGRIASGRGRRGGATLPP